MENTQQPPEEKQAADSQAINDDVVDFATLLSANDVTSELRMHLEIVIGFAIKPADHKRFMDSQVPLPLNITNVIKWVADKVPAGLRFPDPKAFKPENEEGKIRVDRTTEEMIKATQYFIAKAMLAPNADHYRVLGLKIQSSSDEVQQNYRDLRRIFSPSEGMQAAQMCILHISDAYVTLRNAQARREYNERLFGRRSNLYVSNVDLSAENIKMPSGQGQAKAPLSWPTYIGTFFLILGLASMAYWNLHPDFPLYPFSSSTSATSEVSPGEVISFDRNQVEKSKADATDFGSTQEMPSVDRPVVEEEQKPTAKVISPQAATAGEAAQQLTPDIEAAPAVSAQIVKIQKLLKEAEAHIEASRLTQPSGNNAYELFNAVLALDPTNAQAREGMEKIADRYVSLAQFRIESGLYDEAEEMVKRGFQAMPNYPPLISLNDEVQSLLNPVTEEPEESEETAEPVIDATSVAVEQPAQPVPKLVSRPYYHGEDGLVSDIVLNKVVDKFVTSYEKGDLNNFLSLFAKNAHSNNRKSRDGIKSDYETLFSTTGNRLMRVQEIKWKRSASNAVGNTDYILTILRTGDTRPRTFEGSLTFQFEVVEGRLLLTGLFHSQDKVSR